MKLLTHFLVSYLSLVCSLCPNNTIEGNPGDCYFPITIERNFKEAWGSEMACWDFGGHAAYIKSAFEVQFIQQIAQANFTGDYFIGGYLNFIYDSWIWYDGYNMSYTNWGAGQPTAFTNDSSITGVKSCMDGYCGIAVNRTSGKWYVAQQYYKDPDIRILNVICKMPPVLKSCPIFKYNDSIQSEGKMYFSLTDKCYVLFDYPKTNFNASDICGYVSNTSTLTSINSINEQWIIATLIELAYNMQRSNVYIGLHYDYTNNSWKWSDDTPLSYTNWAPGYPFDPTAGSYAGIGSPCWMINCKYQWMNFDSSIFIPDPDSFICETNAVPCSISIYEQSYVSDCGDSIVTING